MPEGRKKCLKGIDKFKNVCYNMKWKKALKYSTAQTKNASGEVLAPPEDFFMCCALCGQEVLLLPIKPLADDLDDQTCFDGYQ